MAAKKSRRVSKGLAVWVGPTTLLLRLLIEIFKH